MAVTYTLRYRSAATDVASAGTWTELTGLTATSQAVTGLSAGVEYDVEVVAVSDGAVESTPVSGARWTRCAPPAAPTVEPAGFVLSSDDDDTNGRLSVSWSAVTGAASYLVATSEDGVAFTQFGGAVTGTSVLVTGLDGTSSYDVQVTARNADGDDATSAATTGTPARIASGGTVTRLPAAGTATHIVHTFIHDGSAATQTTAALVLNHPQDLDVLVVAGGGGGGSGDDATIDGGGGGAGGLILKPGHTVTADSHEVRVGRGGPAEQNGSDSSFDGLVAAGGGGAGERFGSTEAARGGKAGGSGGGARQGTLTGPGGAATQPTRSGDSGTYGHGHAGAAASGSAGGGGGGGAGGAAIGLNGGAGLDRVTVGATTYVFTEVFGSGVGDGGFFASGGAAQGGTASAGGGVDGQSEAASIDVAAAAAGTGGGGGGANDDLDPLGGPGGSGVVIVRYALPT